MDSPREPSSPATPPAADGSISARIEPSPDHAEEEHAGLDGPLTDEGPGSMRLVGLGGSAGSLAALEGFFSALPDSTGMAYVVVVHLAPDHASALAEILQRSTSMPVTQVEESAPVEADHVYVIAPGKTLASANGHLICSDLTPERGRRYAVDLFFRTLADTYGGSAVAVVLSGADSDGSVGIRRVKERGGLAIAQDPEEAEHSSMPRSAIATGMVDWILRVKDMPTRIGAFGDVLGRVRLPPEKKATPAGGERDAEGRESAYDMVLKYVRGNTGRDFSNYKRPTILRRIARRMGVCGVTEMTDYLAFMRTHPAECGALLKDLLISVTNFFRDRDAFDALELQIPALFEGKTAAHEVRVWVPACATGEEAFSIAILLWEHASRIDSPPSLHVFATDLDEDAVRAAREATYSPAIAADVSEERLRRFFTREARGYRIRTELRETVVFAAHDLLKDSPFSRLDLVSCRNLLIYLNREAQERVLEIVHFSLKPGGRLFLGVSETTDAAPDLFRTVDKNTRLFEPLGTQARPPMPAGDGLLARALAQRRTGGARFVPKRNAEGTAEVPWAAPELVGAGTARELHLKLIERLAPASIVVDAQHDIVHLSEGAGRFLHHPGGTPTANLLVAIDPALVVDLRTALIRAQGGDDTVESEPIAWGDKGQAIIVRVGSAPDLAPGYLLVTFVPYAEEAHGRIPVVSDDDAHLRRLQKQIEELKWHLRDATEHGTSTAQELRASNEELQSINEELRSASEELETSREELQSINEELSTVNQELKGKVDELSRSNGDLQNLMIATAIPTVFLDRDLRISLFTPAAVDLFNLIPSDIGRPLSDLSNQLDYPQLEADARSVVDELRSVEREVRYGERWLLARFRPYRALDDRIRGAVLTLLDISEQRRVGEALRESEALFRTIVSQAAAGVAHLDLAGRITLANARFGLIVGRSPASLAGTSIFSLVHPDDRERNVAAFRRLAEEGEAFDMEKRFVRPDDSAVWVAASATAVLDADERPAAAVAILLDIGARRHAEHALRESEERLRLVVANAREYAILTMDLKRRITGWNSGALGITGYTAEEAIGESGDIIFTEEDRIAGAPQREAAVAIAEGRAADERWHRRKDGTRFWGSGVMMSMRDADSTQPIGLLKIFRDQTQARAAEQALESSRAELVQALVDNRKARAEAEAASHAKDRFLAILSHELRTPLTPVVMALHALERNVELPGSLRGTVELIRRNVRAELMLIDDLLDVTRISSGKLEMSRAQTDMHDVVHAAADVCAADFAAKRQRVVLALHAARHVVPGDAARLQQVIWNLLKNAAKFTPNDGEIRVVSSNVEDRFVLVVADTGIGIGNDALAQIFDAFAQEGPWVTSEFGGLGLGLAIAKATVEAHHGTLAAASPGRNQGATFTVELPLD